MLPNIKSKLTVAVVSISLIVGGLVFGASAYAATTPTVSAYATGNGDNVQLNVTGDDNSSVILFYQNATNNAPSENILGETDSNGNFSETISTGAYGIADGSTFYVTVNGGQSTSMNWPYNNGSSGSSSTISLSQTSLTLAPEQSSAITVNNANGSTVFLEGNSSPNVANVSFNGDQFTVTANTYGSTSIEVCLTSQSSDCATVAVNVPSSSAINFSQNNVTVQEGESLPITISGGDTGAYTVTNNTNSGVIQTSISSSTIYLYTSQTSGSAVITICASDMSSCGVINATAGTQSSSALSFSPNNPTISVGQTSSVVVSGGGGVYYVQSNSDPAAVQDSLSGTNADTITLYANAAGSALLNVCASSGGCGTFTVTVSGSNSAVTLNQSNLTVSPGQTSSVLVSGGNGSGYYLNGNTDQSVAYGSIVDNDIVNVAGVNAGTSDITVCQTSSECATIDVTVSGNATSSSEAPQLALVVGVDQTIYITLTGGSTPYSLSNVPTSVFQATLNGSSVAISGVAIGNSSMNVCSSNGACTAVYVYVIAASSAAPPTVSENSGSSGSSNYQFTEYMYPGLRDESVTVLQERLTALGVYSGPVTGYYGTLTENAVIKYQNENGISPLGVVGPETRALLNKY